MVCSLNHSGFLPDVPNCIKLNCNWGKKLCPGCAKLQQKKIRVGLPYC